MALITVIKKDYVKILSSTSTLRAVVFIACVMACSSSAYAKPKAGFGIISGFSSDEKIMASLIHGHIINIAVALGIFDIANPANLIEQKERYGCYDEQCTLLFAREAGLQLIVIGSVKRAGGGYDISIRGYGLDIPYNGKLFGEYNSRIHIDRIDASDRRTSYIAEEIASEFMTIVCRKFVTPAVIINNQIQSSFSVSGTYTYYEVVSIAEGFSTKRALGNVEIRDNKVLTPIGRDDCIIFIDFKKQSDEIQAFYYGRKKEIVFSEATFEESCALIAFTVPASASMPLVVPLFGYYANEDYHGLLLWTANVVPYIAMQGWGLSHSPESLKKRNHDVSRHDYALYYFGWYMLLAGGMPSFVDAFSHQYVERARYYETQVPILGDPKNEIYLALLGGGSGMFYKGHRFWGYMYFHLSNICIYGLLYHHAQPLTWDEDNQSYNRGSSNKRMMHVFAGLLSVLKIVEIVHTLSTPYNISVSDDASYQLEAVPLLYATEHEKVMGLSCAMRF